MQYSEIEACIVPKVKLQFLFSFITPVVHYGTNTHRSVRSVPIRRTKVKQHCRIFALGNIMPVDSSVNRDQSCNGVRSSLICAMLKYSTLRISRQTTKEREPSFNIE